jgi:hypothetical protein
MREVRSQDWADFCRRLNDFVDGGTVTVEVMNRQGARRPVAGNVPFGEITFEKHDACSDRITVRSSGDGAIRHDIIEPIHVKLQETEGGLAFGSVIIEAEEEVTILTFHPVIKTGWLEGMELQ